MRETLDLSLKFYRRTGGTKRIVRRLKEIPGKNYDGWASFMSFIASSHRWGEGHMDERSHKDDTYAGENLSTLLNEVSGINQVLGPS